MLYERTTWQYDRCGNVLLEQRHGGYWDKNGVLVKEDGAGLALRFTYDSRNRRIRVEDGLGAVISCRYDVQGKLVYEEKAVSKRCVRSSITAMTVQGGLRSGRRSLTADLHRWRESRVMR